MDMKAVYTKKFKEAILKEIDCWEKNKDSDCFNLIFRIPYPQKPLKSRDIVSNARRYIEAGFIEKCVFSKRQNGNWMCDSYPNYGYSEHTTYFSLGYLELKEDKK